MNHSPRPGAAAVKLGDWSTVLIEVEEGLVGMGVNGAQTRSGDVPIGTAGALGLVVNFASDATKEIREVQVALLSPTAAQLQELQTPAAPGKPME